MSLADNDYEEKIRFNDQHLGEVFFLGAIEVSGGDENRTFATICVLYDYIEGGTCSQGEDVYTQNGHIITPRQSIVSAVISAFDRAITNKDMELTAKQRERLERLRNGQPLNITG